VSAYTEVLPADAPRGDWLRARRTGIGSSDIAGILGQSAWSSPYSVWCDKTGQTDIDLEPSESMEWGTRLEPVVAQAWSEKNNEPVRRVGLCRSTSRPWQLATPDRLCHCNGLGLLETKTDAGWNDDEWDDTVPLRYLVQLLWQMDTLGAEHGHLAVLLGGNCYRDYTVAPDPDITALMRERAAEFWTHVEAGTRPAVDGSDATTAALKARFAIAEEGVVGLDVDWLAELDRRVQLKAQANSLLKDAQLIDNRLIDALGDHTHGVAAGLLIATRKPRKDGVRVLNVTDPAKRKELSVS